MTNHLHDAFASNPMIMMADLGLRALDMTMSSSHRLCDGIDQLTRAAANQPARRRPVPHDMDVVTQAWVNWFEAAGAVTSLGARRGLPPGVRVKTGKKQPRL